RVRMSLGRRVELGPGTYWLALHEGDWLSEYDGSLVFLIAGTRLVGQGVRSDTIPEAPSSWNVYSDNDSAFVLYDPVLFASGFDAGTTCAWSAAVPGVCP